MTSETDQSLLSFGEEEDVLHKNKKLCLQINDCLVKRKWHNELAAAARVSETDVTIYYWLEVPDDKRKHKVQRMRQSVPVNGEQFLRWMHGKSLDLVKNMLERKRLSVSNNPRENSNSSGEKE